MDALLLKQIWQGLRGVPWHVEDLLEATFALRCRAHLRLRKALLLEEQREVIPLHQAELPDVASLPRDCDEAILTVS